MKKIIIVLLILLPMLGFAQKHSTILKQTDSIVTPQKFKPYVSVGLSLASGSDFINEAYPSIEVGMCKENISLGLVLGRQNLNYTSDSISNYYFEPKITGSLPIGSLTGTLIFGWGKYIDTPHAFIEYGSGLSYSVKNIAYGITYSNFDKIDYLTPSITYTFN